MALFDEMGIDKEVYENAEEQKISEGGPIKSGIYVAKPELLATFKTGSENTVMMKAVFKITDGEYKDKEIVVYQNIVKKNGEPNEIGTATFKHIIDATNLDPNSIVAVQEEIVGYKDKVQAKVAKLGDVKVKLFVREVFEEGADYERYNNVEGYARLDGTNAKGENIEEKFMKKIEKTPIQKKKSKNNNSNNQETSNSASQKDLENML